MVTVGVDGDGVGGIGVGVGVGSSGVGVAVGGTGVNVAVGGTGVSVVVGGSGVPALHPTTNNITNVNPMTDPNNFPQLILPSFLGGHEPSRPTFRFSRRRLWQDSLQ